MLVFLENATNFLQQPDLPWGQYNETSDSFDGLFGAIADGTYDCDINFYMFAHFRTRHVLFAPMTREPPSVRS